MIGISEYSHAGDRDLSAAAANAVRALRRAADLKKKVLCALQVLDRAILEAETAAGLPIATVLRRQKAMLLEREAIIAKNAQRLTETLARLVTLKCRV